MDMNMKGQVALVTGASGEIGAEIARLLAREGVSVALHYHSNEASVARLGEEISRLGVPYTTVQADLSNEEHVRTLWDKVEQELGPIDVLIANAGTYRQELIGIQNLSLDEWNHTLRTNLTSVFLCFREFFNGIVRHALTSPSAVMIGSMSGVWGDIGHCDYAASKAGMLSGLLPTLKDELTRLAPNGRINAV